MLAGWFARRYFFSKKSHSVINLIAGVSVVSVAVPVAAMIVLLSVFNGFEQLVRSMNSHKQTDTGHVTDLDILQNIGSIFIHNIIDNNDCRFGIVTDMYLTSVRDCNAG